MRSLCVLFVAVVISGCGDDGGPGGDPDAGLPDAPQGPSVDAAMPDGPPPPALKVRSEGAAVTQLRFGSLSIGSDAVLTVAVHNLSSAAVAVDVAITGDDAAAFPIDAAASSCDDGPVAAGASCALAVHFAPASIGVKTATLALSIGGSPSVSVALDGVAAADVDLVFDPPGRDFGLTEIGVSLDQTIGITNAGDGPLALDRVVVAGATFTLASTTCGASLEAGATCAATVRFAPTVLGGLAGNLLVVTDRGAASAPLGGAGGFRLTVTRTGDGSGTVLSEPAGIACGDVCTGLFTGRVSLYTDADAGSRFVRWAAPCAAQSCVIEPRTTPATASARFEPADATRTLTVIAAGGPIGEVATATAEGSMLCTSACTYTLPIGTAVAVSATAPGGHVFSGACTGDDDCSVVVDDDLTVTATFGPSPGAAWIAVPSFRARAASFAPDRDLVVAGDSILARYSPTGVLRWSISMPIVPDPRIIDIAVDGAGSIYVHRSSRVDGAPAQLTLEKFDGFGILAWTRTVGTSDFHGDVPLADTLDTSPGGDVAVAVAGERTTVYTAAGAVRWSASGGHGGVAYGPDGTLFRALPVGGRLPCCSKLLRYDSTGAVTEDTETFMGFGGDSLDVGADGAILVQTRNWAASGGTLHRLGSFQAPIDTPFNSGAGKAVALTGGSLVSIQLNPYAPGQPAARIYDSTGTVTADHGKRAHELTGLAADSTGRFAVVGYYLASHLERRVAVIEVFAP
jgi:hypothetical protein